MLRCTRQALKRNKSLEKSLKPPRVPLLAFLFWRLFQHKSWPFRVGNSRGNVAWLKIKNKKKRKQTIGKHMPSVIRDQPSRQANLARRFHVVGKLILDSGCRRRKTHQFRKTCLVTEHEWTRHASMPARIATHHQAVRYRKFPPYRMRALKRIQKMSSVEYRTGFY